MSETDLKLRFRPFASAIELRQAHLELLSRDESTTLSQVQIDEVRQFCLKAKATGQLIWVPEERRWAQAIVDFWSAKLISLPNFHTDAASIPFLDPFDRSQLPDLNDKPCPFVGLDAFGEEDAPLFFGRAREVNLLLQKLTGEPVVVIHGPSGSGKSSLVFAGALAARAHALVGLWLSFLVDRGGWLKEQIRPAVPTLDSGQILDLVRLRLESLQFSAGVVEITLEAEACRATAEQLHLFSETPVLSRVEGPKRDLDAANRALARLRAEFGDETVVRAKLKDGHLPEARFAWEPLDRVNLPRHDLNNWNDLNEPVPRPLVRRIMAKPMCLPGVPRYTHEDGWLILGHKYGSVDKLSGPYVFSGGWWNKEIQRDYYYAETRRGAIAWVYYDRVRRRWFLQGWIE